MNLVFIIGIVSSWILQSFGNVDEFYIALLLLLIPLNIYLILTIRKNEKSTHLRPRLD